MKPYKDSIAVICGNGVPTGNSVEFKTSPIAATIAPHIGPNTDDVIKIDMNLSGILIAFPILNVQYMARTTVKAVSNPNIHSSLTVNFFNPKKFFIIKNPFCGLQKGIYNILFLQRNARNVPQVNLS